MRIVDVIFVMLEAIAVVLGGVLFLNRISGTPRWFPFDYVMLKIESKLKNYGRLFEVLKCICVVFVLSSLTHGVSFLLEIEHNWYISIVVYTLVYVIVTLFKKKRV